MFVYIFTKEIHMQWFIGKQITQVEIGSHPDGYSLYEKVNKSTEQWATLLLVKSFTKTYWELGWNGKRLSDGHGAKSLYAYDPIILQWVITTLEQARRY
jgi:hypothetical protein